MKKVKGGITRPKGFFAGAVWCGMKKRSKDLCLIYSQVPARAAGVFTANKVKAAPLLISEKNLKLTMQRKEILDIFLRAEKHLSVDDLYDIARKRNPNIGHATVFRTLRLLKDAGIANEVELGDKRIRYEHKYGHKHHDHLICVKCGKFIEVIDENIEKLQNELCKRIGFQPQRHKMEIYGICKKCRRKI